MKALLNTKLFIIHTLEYGSIHNTGHSYMKLFGMLQLRQVYKVNRLFFPGSSFPASWTLPHHKTLNGSSVI